MSTDKRECPLSLLTGRNCLSFNLNGETFLNLVMSSSFGLFFRAITISSK